MKSKRITAITFLFLCTLILWMIPAKASAVHNYVQIVTYSKNGNKASNNPSYYSEMKITSIKSSDTSIATVSYKNHTVSNGYIGEYSLKLKKTGTVTITRNYVASNGDLGSSSQTFKVIAYKAPAKKLKIGKKDFSKKALKSHRFEGKAFTGKVTCKANKGWKFDRIYKFDPKTLLTPEPTTQEALSLNKNFTLKKGERLVLMFKKGTRKQSISYTAK